MRKVSKSAVYLCILLIVNEFGPAHFRRLHTPKSEIRARHEKRGFTGAARTLLKYAFKTLEFGAKYVNDVTTLVNVISTVYAAIATCESSQYHAKTKEYTDKADAMILAINTGSPNIYAIQLETKNLQVQVETLNYNYNNTLEEMQKAGYLSEETLQIIQPDLEAALNQTTLDIETSLQEANAAGTAVDYATLSKQYALRIDKIVNLAVPLFVTVIPRIPKIIKFARKRVGDHKSWQITKKFNNINLPGRNTPAFKGLKSWFGKSSDYIKNAKIRLRTSVTGKYTKAIKVVENLKKGFAVLSGLVFGAYNIYSAVQNFGQAECKKLQDTALEGLEAVTKAHESYTSILANVTGAKEEMLKVKDEMIGIVSSEVFLEDLKNMKENMISIQGDGNDGMQDMIDATATYLEGITDNTNIDQVDALTNNLYENAIGTLPFIYQCVNDRLRLISTVAKECKEGKGTLQEEIDFARILFGFEIEQCEARTGIPYFSNEALENMINSAAESQEFEKECKLNNNDVIQLICSKKCNRDSPEAISQNLDISLTGVNSVIQKCPLCELSAPFPSIICLLRKTKTDEEIQKDFPQFTVQQIAAVECPQGT